MKTFVKNYIGKGKKIDNMEIIRMSLKVEDLVKFSHKYNDVDYITFEIARLKNPDQFGHDHTAYVNRLQDSAVNEPVKTDEPASKKRRISKKLSKMAQTQDIPF